MSEAPAAPPVEPAARPTARRFIGRAFTVVRRGFPMLAAIGLVTWALGWAVSWLLALPRWFALGLPVAEWYLEFFPFPSLRELLVQALLSPIGVFGRAAFAVAAGLVLTRRHVSPVTVLTPIRRCARALLGLAALDWAFEISRALVQGFGRQTALLSVLAALVLFMLFMVTPALVEESRRPFDAMARSIELTRGRRWQLLAAFLVAGLPGFLLTFVRASIWDEAADLRLALAIADSAFVRLPFNVLPAVAFHLLREAREGARTEGLAEVFE